MDSKQSLTDNSSTASGNSPLPAPARLNTDEDELRIRAEEYRIALRHSGLLVFRYDVETKTAYTPDSFENPFGIAPVLHNIPDSLFKIGTVASEDIDTCIKFFDAINRGEREGSGVARLVLSGGKFRYYKGNFTSIFGSEGQPYKAVISLMDITELREKELVYEKWRQSIASKPKESVVYYEFNLTADCCEVEQAHSALDFSKFSGTFDYMAKYASEHFIYPPDAESFLEFHSRNRLLELFSNGTREVSADFRTIADSQNPRWTNVNIQMVSCPYTSDIKAFILFSDVNEKKKREIQTKIKLYRDDLTAVYKRDAFIAEFEKLLLPTSTENKLIHALLMLDIDHFKLLNDSFGHAFGDSALINIADCIRSVVHGKDLIGRYGGDEFLICLPNVGSAENAKEIAQKLCDKIQTISLDGKESVSASIGISIFPDDGSDFDTLCRKADIALYNAKIYGRNRVVIYK